jgi:Archaeal adenylate kinase
LIEGFAEFRAANQGYGVIFDGHTVIDSDSGIVDVPLDIIIGLNLSAFVYIRDASESIARRRAADTARQRPERTSEILALHQDRAQALARDYAAKANSSFEVIQAGDIARFQAVADKLFGV